MTTQNGEITFVGALSQVGLYKKTQGRLVRQLTALTIAVIILLGAYTFSGSVMRGVANRVAPVPVGKGVEDTTGVTRALLQLGVPTLLGLIGCWIAYRAVNYPRFADFLISVEAEMDKVSWPSMAELKRGTVVVISVMVSLGIILSLYNWGWLWFFKIIGVIEV